VGEEGGTARAVLTEALATGNGMELGNSLREGKEEGGGEDKARGFDTPTLIVRRVSLQDHIGILDKARIQVHTYKS
jgi:hypothetical protein